MKAFIRSSKIISPQNTFNGSIHSINEVQFYREYLTAIEPNYKDFINPMKLRRMSRLVKMGLTTASECLKNAGIEKPGGIITATGWGCLTDTFNFLDEISEKKEETLSPATFIQSTHNTIGGQIALVMECQEYNSVTVNHTSSFEHALFEALLLLSEGKDHILVGGADEINKNDIELKRLAGLWKDRETDNHSLFSSHTAGTLAGEGAAFFLLERELSQDCKSQIDGVYFYSEDKAGEELPYLEDADFIICGYNGDIRTKSGYPEIEEPSKAGIHYGFYKHLCGEYDTASSFALGLADQIIASQEVPEFIMPVPGKIFKGAINKIVIHHYLEPGQHAFILVSKAGI